MYSLFFVVHEILCFVAYIINHHRTIEKSIILGSLINIVFNALYKTL